MTFEAARSDGDAMIPVQFFHEVHRAFENACDAAGSVEHRYFRVGGLLVELRFAGSALLPAMTAAPVT